MDTFYTRKNARNAMIDVGATKYRIRDGHIDFYGIMPNSMFRGWYTAGYCGF